MGISLPNQHYLSEGPSDPDGEVGEGEKGARESSQRS